MAYSLQFHEERVLRYLREYQPFSRAARVRLFANLHFDLGEHGDTFRFDPGRRVVPDSDLFFYELLLLDKDGDGRVRLFSFIVNDRNAKYGVLVVEFVEVKGGP